MNERILEYAEQARLHAKSVFPNSIDDPTGWNYEYHKKFAELIVRECVSICEINGQSYKHSFTPAKARLAESTSNHCAMIITKHFGVE